MSESNLTFKIRPGLRYLGAASGLLVMLMPLALLALFPLARSLSFSFVMDAGGGLNHTELTEKEIVKIVRERRNTMGKNKKVTKFLLLVGSIVLNELDSLDNIISVDIEELKELLAYHFEDHEKENFMIVPYETISWDINRKALLLPEEIDIKL